MLSTIRRQVSEIGYLVDEFSNFARLPNPTLLNEDIYSIIDDIIDDYKNDNQSIVFEKNFEQKSFEIKIDKSQISRVFQNIIINSIHSIEEKSMNDGKITY